VDAGRAGSPHAAEAKRYIAKNNIQLYTINAIDKAIEIGLGKRTNTILQSAFFALAGVLPKEDALKFMKEAAYKSFAKKGDAIVEMNYKAIDAGFDAFVKIDVPASWADANDAEGDHELAGNPATVKMVKEILFPVDKMDGDSLPVSAFVDQVDGQFEQGASAYEKRGVAVSVPEWDVYKVHSVQPVCLCLPACHHPSVCFLRRGSCRRPRRAEGEADDRQRLRELPVRHDGLSAGLHGLRRLLDVCPAPGKALKMMPQESQLAQQEVFDYAVANVGKKEGMMAETTVKGSQFNQPLLEFSGSCAGCAETSYARLITQLYGERMYIANATGCSSIWGGPAATSPYTRNRLSGKGPAWANSLFEDNAEHGFGMYLGQKTIRESLADKTRALIAVEYALPDLKAAAQEWLDTMEDGKLNPAAADKYIAALENGVLTVEEGITFLESAEGKAKFGDNAASMLEHMKSLKAAGKAICDCEACTLAAEILEQKQYLAKKSVWIFGGDGWAYDIGYGGLDHVLASGEDVNVMVFDTEVYSNTGGQASKASQIGQVAQFAAAGKAIGKKNLAEIAMSYGYVYVAQIAMGADKNQTIKAITEAESYHGPSLIIGYAPCEMHGVKGGMTNCQNEMKRAVEAGYWNMFRFDPRKKAEGKNPFTIDSKAPTADYKEFIESETRYSRLQRAFPERAQVLFDKAADAAKDRYEYLGKLAKLYE
jgi:pyruvate-ferredoxin/flavodoxin oxidoreductase